MSSPPNVVINIGGQQPVSGPRPKHGAPPFPPPSEGPEGYYGPPHKKEHRSFFANLLIGASVVTTAATIVGAGLIYHYSPRAAASMLQKLEKKSKLPSFLKDIKNEEFTGLGESAKKQKPFVLKSMAFGYKIAGKFTAAVAKHLPETSSIKEGLGHLSTQFKSLATESKSVAAENKALAKKAKEEAKTSTPEKNTSPQQGTEHEGDDTGLQESGVISTEPELSMPIGSRQGEFSRTRSHRGNMSDVDSTGNVAARIAARRRARQEGSGTNTSGYASSKNNYDDIDHSFSDSSVGGYRSSNHSGFESRHEDGNFSSDEEAYDDLLDRNKQ